MREALRAVQGIDTAGEKMIRMGITKDGSSIGAAIVVLVVTQQMRVDPSNEATGGDTREGTSFFRG